MNFQISIDEYFDLYKKRKKKKKKIISIILMGLRMLLNIVQYNNIGSKINELFSASMFNELNGPLDIMASKAINPFYFTLDIFIIGALLIFI